MKTENPEYIAREARLAQAIEIAHSTDKPNWTRLSEAFNVSRTTLRDRANGGASKSNRKVGGRLTYTQEQALKSHIADLTAMDASPTKASLMSSANAMIAEAALPGESVKPVSKMWAPRYMHRNDAGVVKAKPLEVKRKMVHDPKNIAEWFERYRWAVKGIPPSNIWNFDETGVMIGQGKPQKVVSTNPGRNQYTGSLINRESATVVESVSANGEKIDPFVVLKGSNLLNSWVQQVPVGYTLLANESGYLEDTAALEYLHHFIERTKHLTQNGKKKILLLLDNAPPHTSFQFWRMADRNHIKLHYFPPHLSHLIQPLDVSVFQQWKMFHGKAIDKYALAGVTSFSKLDFLAELHGVRTKAMKSSTIKSGFRHAGLWPVNSSKVLRQVGESAEPEEASSPAAEGSTQLMTSGDLPQTPRSATRYYTSVETPRTPRQFRRFTRHIEDQAKAQQQLPSVAVVKYAKGALFHVEKSQRQKEHLERIHNTTQKQAKRKEGGRSQAPRSAAVKPMQLRNISDARLDGWRSNLQKDGWKTMKKHGWPEVAKGTSHADFIEHLKKTQLKWTEDVQQCSAALLDADRCADFEVEFAEFRERGERMKRGEDVSDIESDEEPMEEADDL